MTEDDLRTLLRERSAGADPSPDLAYRAQRAAQKRRDRELVVGGLALMAVLVGVALLVLPRHDAAAPVEPGRSASPSATARHASPPLVVDLNQGYPDLIPPRTVTALLLLSNQSGQPVTITGWTLVDPSGSTRVALAPPLPNGANESLLPSAQRALLAAPPRRTAALADAQDINLLVELTPTCTAADKRIAPRIEFDIRYGDGSTTRQTITALEDNLLLVTKGKGWVAETIDGICHPR